MAKYIPPHETSCLCDCGCFLIALEDFCPICGAANPVSGNKSLAELENEYTDDDPND
jgi:hypothetical protein